MNLFTRFVTFIFAIFLNYRIESLSIEQNHKHFVHFMKILLNSVIMVSFLTNTCVIFARHIYFVLDNITFFNIILYLISIDNYCHLSSYFDSSSCSKATISWKLQFSILNLFCYAHVCIGHYSFLTFVTCLYCKIINMTINKW